ncbi:MFS multidrug transporter [Zopfia rhizophila CBS 207.26]|uniref:MFS multidrug transporter n=1 Tax=Zopfia rhizophila CBS 207.26 TaxID=1314779 RepID=A0A6A6DVH7_9PEZI|nr:MFS multidrug transporter [Zopfia rhizophila CBS 207.26]
MIIPNSSDIITENQASKLEKGLVIPDAFPVSGEPQLVTWDGLSDPSNPLNWSQGQKWFTTLLASLGGLVTLMSGAMLAPVLAKISKDLRVSDAEASLTLSVYILAFAFGPMVLAPCSEVFGRRPVWIAGSVWYIAWNTLCGFSRNMGLMIVGRLMAGLGASAEFAVSNPIVNDCWRPEDRGKSFAIRGFLPLLGPALGPIVGGVIIQKADWRWLFWVLSIFDSIIVVLFAIALPESHAPTILSRKAKDMSRVTGRKYRTEADLTSPTLTHRLKIGLVRPYRLLLTQPAIQLVSLFLAYSFGLLYVALSTFSTLWTERYKQSSAVSGVHYLAIVIGYTFAAQVGGWLTDRVWARLKEKNQGQAVTENRVPLMVPGALLVPIGLLWYGWAAQQRLHWIMPDTGIAIFGCGFIAGGQAAQAYIVDAFLDYTASAGAASQLLRNIFAFAFPVFAPGMYSTLGYGWGNTILAAIAICVGIPAPYILWKYGARLREKWKALK